MGNFFGCFHVEEYTRALKEKNGKFDKELRPGFHCVPWCFGHQIGGHVSMKTQQLTVSCNHKTKDNVFVTVVAALHYGVLDVVDVNNAKKAFYVHNDAKSLIADNAFDVIKSTISKNTFDELFEKKDEFTSAVNEKLNEMISGEYGFGNFKTLLLDISPEEPTKCTINVTNAAPKMASAVTGATPEVIQMLLATQCGPATPMKEELLQASSS